MKNGKCPNCGSILSIDPDKEAIICQYCNTPIISEKAIKNYDSSLNATSTNNAQTIINNYYANTSSPKSSNKPISIVKCPPRPKVNVLIAILGLCFYIVPGLIYLANIKNKQDKWDEKYGDLEE